MRASQPAAASFPGAIAREWAAPSLLAGVWSTFYVWRAFRAHAGLLTNAYDLSLFDYTLWSTLHGRLGYVPFMHSIFSHHFMPVILLVAPIYALWPSPEWVIVIQTVALAAGALAFFAVARRLGLGWTSSLALMVVLLISRRSHSASVSYFYFESFQPLLMYLLVLAWLTERWRLFWISTALLLMTKEDMPLYLVAFAALNWFAAPAQRRRLRTLAGVSAAWMLMAFTGAIPLARILEGHTATNPFFESRFGAVGTGLTAVRVILGRVFSLDALRSVFAVLASVGLLSLGAPRWLLVAAPAVLLCVSLAPGNMQTVMLGHYALPILPWVFVSAAAALVRMARWSPRFAGVFVAALLVGTVADAPVARHTMENGDNAEASAVLRQLRLPAGSAIAVQPNLIPHLPHSFTIRSLEPPVLAAGPDAVMITRVGDLWPFSPAEISALIARYQSDSEYEQVVGGPLYVFERRRR